MTSRARRTIGIVFALPQEQRGLEHVLLESHSSFYRSGNLRTWYLKELTLLAAVGGVGRKRCTQATQELLEAGAQWILSAGFAAALDPSIRVGDIIVADRVLSNEDNEEAIACDQRLVRTIPPSGKFGFVIRHGSLVSWNSVVCAAAEKNQIHRTTGAAALDMESYAAAQVCARAKVPFAAVRSISDTANENLPEVTRRLATTPEAFRAGIILMSNPQAWFLLLRLRRQAELAANNLGEVLGLMLLRLV